MMLVYIFNKCDTDIENGKILLLWFLDIINIIELYS